MNLFNQNLPSFISPPKEENRSIYRYSSFWKNLYDTYTKYIDIVTGLTTHKFWPTFWIIFCHLHVTFSEYVGIICCRCSPWKLFHFHQKFITKKKTYWPENCGCQKHREREACFIYVKQVDVMRLSVHYRNSRQSYFQKLVILV